MANAVAPSEIGIAVAMARRPIHVPGHSSEATFRI